MPKLNNAMGNIFFSNGKHISTQEKHNPPVQYTVRTSMYSCSIIYLFIYLF